MSPRTEETYWNGKPTPCEIARVVVADDPESRTYWARRFVGEEREVVLVHYEGETFALDNEGYTMSPEEVEALAERWPGITFSTRHGFPGWGWDKVTAGAGGPSYPHLTLQFERIRETAHDQAA